MFHPPLPWLFALIVGASAAPTAVLTPHNFKDAIATGVWFVEHFSPYCRHCRNFEPTWNDVVSRFEAMQDPGVHLAQVNCALNGDLCNDNGVAGYPQMNLYRHGEFVETYNADRDYDLLVEYLDQHAEREGTSVTEEALPTPTPTPTPTTEDNENVIASTPSPTAALIVQTPRTDANPSGTVVALDVQSFDNFLAQGPVFIKFFAPWCGHCKKLAPTWTQLAQRMQHKLNVAEVDCEQHKALCTSQGVTGFPMMFYYAHSTKTEYTGGRSFDQLVAFADRASDPTMQAIDASQLAQVVRDHDVLYLFLHDASDQRIVNDIAKSTQFLLGAPPVYVATAPALFHTYALPPNTPSALLAFKDQDAREPVSVFYPTHDAEALKTWLHVHRFPSALELSKDVFQQVMYAPHKPLVVIVATPDGHARMVSDKLRQIAGKWRSRMRARSGGREVVFTWMDVGQWGKWMKDMYGVRATAEPAVVVADHERLVYYTQDGAGYPILLNAVSVASALEAVLAGTATPRHSQNVFERTVRSLNGALVDLQAGIVAHPYVTALAVLGLIGAVVMALRSVLSDTPPDWEAEKRCAKGDRLD